MTQPQLQLQLPLFRLVRPGDLEETVQPQRDDITAPTAGACRRNYGLSQQLLTDHLNAAELLWVWKGVNNLYIPHLFAGWLNPSEQLAMHAGAAIIKRDTVLHDSLKKRDFCYIATQLVNTGFNLTGILKLHNSRHNFYSTNPNSLQNLLDALQIDRKMAEKVIQPFRKSFNKPCAYSSLESPDNHDFCDNNGNRCARARAILEVIQARYLVGTAGRLQKADKQGQFLHARHGAITARYNL